MLFFVLNMIILDAKFGKKYCIFCIELARLLPDMISIVRATSMTIQVTPRDLTWKRRTHT